jgi:hypothetical protein
MVTIVLASIIVAMISLVGTKKSSGGSKYMRNTKGYEGLRYGIYDYSPNDNNVNSYIVAHTAFVIGQFFAWVYILRLELQFLNIQCMDETSSLANPFFAIEKAWSDQDIEPTHMLW